MIADIVVSQSAAASLRHADFCAWPVPFAAAVLFALASFWIFVAYQTRGMREGRFMVLSQIGFCSALALFFAWSWASSPSKAESRRLCSIPVTAHFCDHVGCVDRIIVAPPQQEQGR
jgi:hypothetical protein